MHYDRFGQPCNCSFGELNPDGKEHVAASPKNLKWEPGTKGKGLVTPKGEVYTWKTNEDGFPHHAEYLNAHKLYDLDEGMGYFFKIKDNGEIDEYGSDKKIIKLILEADDRLKNSDKNDHKEPTLSPREGPVKQPSPKVGHEPPEMPPNLRHGSPRRNCASCTMFHKVKDGKGKCWGYLDYPVDATELCDSYEQDKGSSWGRKPS